MGLARLAIALTTLLFAGCGRHDGATACADRDAAVSEAGAMGCFVRTTKVCQGSSACEPLCAAAQFELSCESGTRGGASPSPDSTLGCQIVPLPTPSGTAFYCCPCRN